MAAPSDRVLLLSIRPRFADAILSGTKTVELRRRPIKASPGTLVILYASTPTMAVVGTARLRKTVVCGPDTAWRSYRSSLGLARHEFDAYLEGNRACLLLLEDVSSLEDPISLQDLREDCDFWPPQSYRYVSALDPASVRSLIPG